MEINLCIISFINIFQYVVVSEAAIVLEVESYVMDKFTINRDAATGHGSVNFKTGDSFKIYFCLLGETKINLNNVRYSNDGGGDTVEFSIDGIPLGVLMSTFKSNYGKEWNNFISSGPIGPNITLSSGRHFITVTVNKTDFYGIELDHIEFSTGDSYIREDVFKCSLFCDHDITYSNGPSRDDMSSAVITKKFVSSVCQTKNVILPIYHEDVKMFLVTMVHPKYRSFENNFPDGRPCKAENNTIWEFKNIEISSTYSIVDSRSDINAVFEYGSFNTSKTLYMRVLFESSLFISKHATRLVLKFQQVAKIFLCICKYRHRNGIWFTLSNAFFSPQKATSIWLIPKNTWSTSNEVICDIIASPQDINLIVLDQMKLVFQMPSYDIRDILYSSYDTKIEVVMDDLEKNVSLNGSMTVRNVDNNKIFNHVSEIVIFQRLPWADTYSPVMKLSKTGEMNVLPIVPHGLVDIPYGSSFIIGQNDPDDELPSAPVFSVEIAPEALYLFVTFVDGGSTHILIKSTWKDTKVIFKNIKRTKNHRQYPFVTILSTWHYDGNADVDHVSTNGDTPHHIIKGWNKLYGTSFTFFRRCLSKQNTQSPDFRLQLINEKDIYL